MKTHDCKARRNLVHLLICLILTFGIAIPIFAAAPIKTTPAPATTKAPIITATLNADPASYSGACPAVIKFEGKINVAGITKTPITITYEFIRSDGGKDTRPKTLTFKEDGSQAVSTTWTLGDNKRPSYTGWMAIKIAGKPPVESNKANFLIQCKAEQQTQEFKLEDMKFTQKPVRKIPSGLTLEEKQKAAAELNKGLTKLKKSDLVCSIKAYYNEARTMPVESWGRNGGIYHLSPVKSPQRPYPYCVFFTVEVKNIGAETAASNVVNKVVFQSSPAFFPPVAYATSPPENIEPGETAEYDYYYGPFGGAILNNRSIIVNALADYPPHVSEVDENNNTAMYTLRFVWP
jgi:hypothetical protein